MPTRAIRSRSAFGSRVFFSPLIRAAWAVVLAIGFSVFRAPGQTEKTSEDIFRIASPSCVSIQTSEGFGSGVVVSRDGLILTNLHVVPPPPNKFEIQAFVRTNKGVAKKSFWNLQVWKVHPRYDLALVKIEDRSSSFLTLVTPPHNEAVRTGSRCYALGNPGATYGALEQSITEGIVSAAIREVDGLEYMQISAALNPGNSGGPVCDSQGRLIGIATWKLLQAESIGFAIPIQKISFKDFVDPSQRLIETNTSPDITTPNEEQKTRPLIGSISINKETAATYANFARDHVRKSAPLPSEGIVKPLPGKPGKIIFGYAGTCLVMHFPDLQKLGIFDLCEAKFIKYIDVMDADPVFAAGGDVLLIYSREANTIEKWHMPSWTRKGSIPVASVGKISAMGMGLLNPLMAVVVIPESDSPEEKVRILSLRDGRVTPPIFEKSPSGLDLGHLFGHLSHESDVFVEETGKFALVMGGGRGFLNLTNPNRVEATYIHMGGFADGAVSLGGSHVLVGGHGIFQSQSEEELFRKIDEASIEPQFRRDIAFVAGTRSILEIVDQENEVILNTRALPGLGVVSSRKLDADQVKNLSLAREPGNINLFASSYIGRCAAIDRPNQTISLFSMEQETELEGFTDIAPGSLLSRKVSVPAGTKAKIESAPLGVVFDEESSTLHWQIPKDHSRGVTVRVILLLTDPEGKESYLVEEISIP